MTTNIFGRNGLKTLMFLLNSLFGKRINGMKKTSYKIELIKIIACIILLVVAFYACKSVIEMVPLNNAKYLQETIPLIDPDELKYKVEYDKDWHENIIMVRHGNKEMFFRESWLDKLLEGSDYTFIANYLKFKIKEYGKDGHERKQQ